MLRGVEWQALETVLPCDVNNPCFLNRLVSGAGDIKLTKDGNVLLHEMVRGCYTKFRTSGISIVHLIYRKIFNVRFQGRRIHRSQQVVFQTMEGVEKIISTVMDRTVQRGALESNKLTFESLPLPFKALVKGFSLLKLILIKSKKLVAIDLIR